HANVEIAIERILVRAVITAVKNVLGVKEAADPIGNVLVPERVVAPDHRGPILSRRADAALQRDSIRPLLHDSRSDADRFDALQDVEPQHVPEALAAGTEVVPVFLSVAKQTSRLRQLTEIPVGERVADVIPLVGNATQKRNKHQI